MITVTLSKSGTVALHPEGSRDKDVLRDLPYVRRRNGVGATWWTYLGDLKRDVPRAQLRWSPSVGTELSRLVGDLKKIEIGDDEVIQRLFAEGMKPYDFQLRGIHAGMNAERLLIADDTGLGKFQPVDSLVSTPQGWRRIGDIRAGDQVTGSDGKTTTVTGVYPQGVRAIYRVGFSDGSSVEAGDDHLWSVDYRRGGREWTRKTLTTRQLRLRPKVDGLDLSKTRLYLPMLSGPVEFAVPQTLPIPPYVLGALIANGGLTQSTPQLSYAKGDWPEIETQLGGVDLGRVYDRGSAVQVLVRGVIAKIRRLGLNVGSRDKRIPVAYMGAKIEDRKRLLQGLMDADGSVTKTRNRVTYHTISSGLAHDVRELIECLGGIASVRTYGRAHQGKPTEFQVRMRLPSWVLPFSLSRKASRYCPKTPQARPSRVFDKIEFVREAEAVCIAVDAEDRLYLTEHAILTHNTIQTIGIMLRAFELGKINRAVLVVPPGLKYQWYEEIHEFAANAPGPCVVMTPGSKNARAQVYSRNWKILIVNPELVWRDVPLIERIKNSVGLVALDEASCIRNPETQIAESMKYLFGSCRFKLALTATPVENRLLDLKSIFDWVDPRVFMSTNYFNRRYVVWQKRKITVFSKRLKRKVRITKEEPLRYQNLNEVRTKIRPCYIRRRVQDVGLELPGLVVNWETLELPRRQREIYDAVRDKVLEKIKGLRGSALTMPLQALRQACNSTELVARGDTKPVSVKLARLKELLETELHGQQVILFTDYERFGQILYRDLSQYKPALYTGPMNKDERLRAINGFRAGTKQVLIGTRALERGHNLQNAAVVVNMDLPWNPAAIKQRLGRVRRIGSKHHTVRLINMIAIGTVEEKLQLRRLYKKRKTFEDIFGEDELTRADPLEEMVGRDIAELL